MPERICRGEETELTILPWETDGVEDLLIKKPIEYVLGYVTRGLKFRYTESGKAIEADHHWTVDILKKFYSEAKGPWIVFTCSPAKSRDAFNDVYDDDGASLIFNNWDILSVKDKKSKVAVIIDYTF